MMTNTIFYWASWQDNQHSQNIRANEKVFVVIYDSTMPEGIGEGVYILAKAYELNDRSEVEAALMYAPDKSQKAEEYLGSYPRRMYKLIPEKFWMNGDGDVDGNFVDVRFEVNLE